ncbi:MAG TPA: HD domain-containing protein [Deltaproteobacteria bacterium]|nr:HD domain-containing protein [Deltaproteobacteria bacterium]
MRWLALTVLIVFFVLGYVLFVAIQVKQVRFPLEVVTGVVFFGGAFFVLLVISLSRTTISRVQETDRRIESINSSLVIKNRELEKEIAARLAAEERAKLRLQHLTTLHGIDMFINASFDLRVTMKLLLEQAIPQLKMDGGGILLLNTHTQILSYEADWGFQDVAIRKSKERLGQGSAGTAAFDRREIFIPDLAKAGESEFLRHEYIQGENFISYYAVPLVAKGQVKGVFEIFSRSRIEELDPEWLDFVEAFAGQAAIAIDNATLFRKLQESNMELTLAYDTTIEGWSKALELRDSETEGHTQRVTELTLKLACAMGLRDDDIDHVRRGALLHDIGKMVVPDTILMNTGPLTEAEQEIMRQHPVNAFQLLYPIQYLQPAIDIPYCHHEWWDGTGYPRGLKGVQIPLAARIFAIADTWDALLSERRYREAWSREKVIEHIRSLSGTQFDPHLVDVFLTVI